MTEKEFDIIWNLFVESFRTDERRDKEKQFELLSNPLYHLETLQNNKKAIAYIAYWNFDDFLYVEHLATAPEMRGQGIGKNILKELIERVNKLTVLEVEKPHDNIAKRRIQFYKRLGFQVNDYEYFQPSYGKDKNEVPLLFLSNPRQISYIEFDRIRKTIYREVYHKNI